MTTKIITPADMCEALRNANILRSYNVQIRIVETVDNQGAQCEFCAETGALVSANVYLTDTDYQDTLSDCCAGCVTYVIDGFDGSVDTSPMFPVIVEMAQTVVGAP